MLRLKRNISPQAAGIRVSSGIKGLDEYIGGGFVPGSIILVTGKTGTGKTLFASSFLMEGLKRGEKCAFMTTKEPPEKIAEDVMLSFGWDLSQYTKGRVLAMSEVTPYNINIAQSSILQLAQNKVKRVVLDSTNIFEIYLENAAKMREILIELVKFLHDNRVTAMFVAEMPEECKNLSGAGVVEFIADTVILLESIPVAGKYKRALRIRKMRGSEHSMDRLTYDITKGGIEVFKPKDAIEGDVW